MTGFWAERLSQSSRYYLSLPRLWILSQPSQAMVSKLAVLGLINQKSAMWLVQKGKEGEKCLPLLGLRLLYYLRQNLPMHALLICLNQKSATWLVQKGNVSTPLRSLSTILPLPKFTHVCAPN